MSQLHFDTITFGSSCSHCRRLLEKVGERGAVYISNLTPLQFLSFSCPFSALICPCDCLFESVCMVGLGESESVSESGYLSQSLVWLSLSECYQCAMPE